MYLLNWKSPVGIYRQFIYGKAYRLYIVSVKDILGGIDNIPPILLHMKYQQVLPPPTYCLWY